MDLPNSHDSQPPEKHNPKQVTDLTDSHDPHSLNTTLSGLHQWLYESNSLNHKETVIVISLGSYYIIYILLLDY